MALGNQHIKVGPVADSVPYDDSNPLIEILKGAETTQEALDALTLFVQNLISPGWTYGRSNRINKGTYLLNDTVPSNVSGRPIPINGFLVVVAVSVGAPEDFSLDFEEHDGTTFTYLTTVTMTVADGHQKTFLTSGVPVTKNKQLAVRVSPSSSKRPNDLDVAITLNRFEIT
jgi:hypothetical protein